jgi:DNA-binding GntR family transcriptional regulator
MTPTPPLPPLIAPDRRTAGDEAEIALLRGIMDGTIPPGAPLRLQDLVGQLGMSMMPIREALRRLESLGLVDIIPHRGAWVRPLTRSDLYDTYFTRMHLEGQALLAAADRIGPAELELARTALADKRAAEARGEVAAARELHESFHFGLYAASGSEWLMRCIEPAWRNAERYRVESMRDPDHFRARDAEHSLIADALEQRDGVRAVALLVSHLRSSAELVAAELPDDNGTPPLALPGVAEIAGGREPAR